MISRLTMLNYKKFVFVSRVVPIRRKVFQCAHARSRPLNYNDYLTMSISLILTSLQSSNILLSFHIDKVSRQRLLGRAEKCCLR